jgi:hypothetical protein
VVLENEKVPQPQYSNSGFTPDSAKRLLPLLEQPDAVVLTTVVEAAVVAGLVVVVLAVVEGDVVITPPPPGRVIAPAA